MGTMAFNSHKNKREKFAEILASDWCNGMTLRIIAGLIS